MIRAIAYSSLLLTGIAILSLTTSIQSSAQQLPEDKLATFVFDINTRKIFENEFIKELDPNVLGKRFDIAPLVPPGSEFKDLDRLTGALQLSNPINFLVDEIPFEFYIQFHFQTEQQLAKVKDELVDQNFEPIEKNGKTMYVLGGSDEILLFFKGKMLEVGTKLYMNHPDRKFLTPTLETHWETMPQASVKAAIDLVASKECIDAFRKELMTVSAIEGILTAAMVELTDNVTLASLHADLDNEDVFSLLLKTKDGKSSESVKGVADGLLFMLALPLKNIVKMIPIETEEGSTMLLEITEQLYAKKVDGGVGITITKPERFNEIVRRDYLPAIQQLLREAENRENLIEVGRAIRNVGNGENLPFVKTDRDDLSWRVRLLPALYRHRANRLKGLADPNLAWNDEANEELIGEMPLQFGMGGHHSDLVWVQSKVENFGDIKDGRHQTVAILQLPQPTEKEWTNPDSDSISMLAAIKLIKNLPDGKSLNAITYASRVIKLDNTMSHNQLKAYFTPAGGDN